MLIVTVSQAQTANHKDKPDLKFQRIYDGLINNRVSAIHEDSRGYMWIGTYSGLHSYDGLNFQVFKNMKGKFGLKVSQVKEVHFIFP